MCIVKMRGWQAANFYQITPLITLNKQATSRKHALGNGTVWPLQTKGEHRDWMDSH